MRSAQTADGTTYQLLLRLCQCLGSSDAAQVVIRDMSGVGLSEEIGIGYFKALVAGDSLDTAMEFVKTTELKVITCTVEPPSSGHFGTSFLVRYRSVLYMEVECVLHVHR